MKNNVTHKPDGIMDWWTWDEFCDACGKQTRVISKFSFSSKPIIEEQDWYLKCGREELERRIANV